MQKSQFANDVFPALLSFSPQQHDLISPSKDNYLQPSVSHSKSKSSLSNKKAIYIL